LQRLPRPAALTWAGRRSFSPRGPSDWEGAAPERGDFAAGVYEASIRRNPGRIQVLLSRSGNAWGIPFTLAKAVTLEAGSRTLEIAYKLEGLPRGFRQHLAVEFNFAGMPANAAGRFFHDGGPAPHRRSLGGLGSRLDLADARGLGLVDDWLGIDALFAFGEPAICDAVSHRDISRAGA
jgi:alpha-amylase